MSYFKYVLNDEGYTLDKDEVCIKDVIYNNLSEKNKLDLYFPAENAEKYPLVVFIHGGAFGKGDKRRHLGGVLQSLRRGYAVASINYRLNNETTYDGSIKDCIEAIDYLVENQKKYSIDINHIVLWGDTHGAEACAEIAIKCPKNLLKSRTNFKINGVVSFTAPNLYIRYKDQYDSGVFTKFDGKTVVDEATFGLKGVELLEKLKTMDVFDLLDGSECPFYLLHGTLDTHLPHISTRMQAAKLTEKEVSFVLDFVKGGDHGIDFYDAYEYNEPIMRFVDSVI